MKLLRFGRKQDRYEKEKRRRAAFRDSGTWQHDGPFARRAYASYEAYVDHQAAKLDAVRDRLKKSEAQDLAEFHRRFEDCAPLREAGSVLCLGARLGTEVRALHELGHFAVGIDLNPGPDNRWVLTGDFHRLVFPEASVDAVYTNALDHALDLSAVLREIVRVLRPGGLLVIDHVDGFDEGFVPGAFEAFHWRDGETLVGAVREQTGFSLLATRDLGTFRRDTWRQAVLRRPAVRASAKAEHDERPEERQRRKHQKG